MYKKYWFAVFSFCLLWVISCGSAGNSADSSVPQSETVPNGVPALIDLGSVTCVPCRQMEGELELLDSLGGDELDVRFIDVNEHPEDASDYGVRLIPTQIFLSENGDELFRHEGFMSCGDMISKWEELGYTFHGGSQ